MFLFPLHPSFLSRPSFFFFPGTCNPELLLPASLAFQILTAFLFLFPLLDLAHCALGHFNFVAVIIAIYRYGN